MGNTCALDPPETSEEFLFISGCCSSPRGELSRESSLDEGDMLGHRWPPLIIFDWDDTLFCSSELKIRKGPDPEQLKELEKAVAQVLKVAMGLGKTAIVTNANLCWVRATVSLFMPSVLPILKLIDVTSARQSYEEKWPGDPSAWKKHAFRDIVAMAKANPSFTVGSGAGSRCEGQPQGVNLIVLGDSHAEIQAGRSAMKGNREGVVKTVKFKEVPTAGEIIGELQVVSTELRGLAAQEQSANKLLVQGSFSSSWTLCDVGMGNWPSIKSTLAYM